MKLSSFFRFTVDSTRIPKLDEEATKKVVHDYYAKQFEATKHSENHVNELTNRLMIQLKLYLISRPVEVVAAAAVNIAVAEGLPNPVKEI